MGVVRGVVVFGGVGAAHEHAVAGETPTRIERSDLSRKNVLNALMVMLSGLVMPLEVWHDIDECVQTKTLCVGGGGHTYWSSRFCGRRRERRERRFESAHEKRRGIDRISRARFFLLGILPNRLLFSHPARARQITI